MFRNVLMAATLVASTFAYAEYRPYIACHLAKAIMMNPDVTPDDDDDKAICDGSGFITHGDGHKTPCPGCSACKKNDPDPVVNEKCPCGCNQVGCTCQANGNFAKCPEALAAKEAEEEVEEEVEVLPSPKELIEDDDSRPRGFFDSEPIADETPNRPLLVYYFGAEWCPPCQQMKRSTWKDEPLMKMIADKGIQFNKFDADTEAHGQFFNFYKIVDIPATLILDKDNLNDPLRRMVGFTSASSIKKALEKELKDE